MSVLPNQLKEAANLREHRLDFSRAADIPRGPLVEQPDDRPLGYEHEARVRVIGTIGGGRILVLVYQPVDVGDGEIAARPISLRKATREEREAFWANHHGS